MSGAAWPIQLEICVATMVNSPPHALGVHRQFQLSLRNRYKLRMRKQQRQQQQQHEEGGAQQEEQDGHDHHQQEEDGQQ